MTLILTSLYFYLKQIKYKPIFALILFFLALYGGYRGAKWAYTKPPSVYKIGIDSTWYPLGLYGKEGSITAFSTDLLVWIARTEGLDFEIVRTGPKRQNELLEDEYVDGILSALTVTPQVENNYYFSDPYYRYGTVFITRKDFDFRSINDLAGKKIAVKRTSPILYRISIDPKAVIHNYDSPLMALDELNRQEADVVIMDLLDYLYYGGIYHNKFKVATLPLTQEGLRLFTLQKPYMEHLIEKFNHGLERLKQEGIYQKMLDKWDLFNPENPS